jgi:hypothetical protein
MCKFQARSAVLRFCSLRPFSVACFGELPARLAAAALAIGTALPSAADAAEPAAAPGTTKRPWPADSG